MKFLVLALFVAAAVAAPVPDDNSDAVELIVNGVPEGTPLELGGIVEMHLNEHVDGQLASSTNLLHPLTAVGIAEAALAAAESAPTPVQIVEKPESDYHITPDIVVPVEVALLPKPEVEPISLPTPVLPETQPLPAPIQLPSPVLPETALMPESLPAPIALPSPVAPEAVPEAETIVMPEPLPPMVVPMPEPIVPAPIPPTVPEIPEPVPEPAAQGPNEIFNNGVVQVQVNAPEDAGLFSTLQSWFSLVVNYISNGIQTSEQIV